MSYQHLNRLLAHWLPKIKPEGLNLTWGSIERYKSLTPGAVAVALAVASHLNQERNFYGVSVKTLVRELGFAKSTIGKALDELVEWGIFTRERTHYELPYVYRLAIPCPSDCDLREIHNTPSELATLPKKQATPSPNELATPQPKEQATGGLNNRQLIDINKEINKEMNNKQQCFNCSGVFEALPNGNREIIHSHDCAQLTQLKRGQAWNITQGELGSNWESLDNREQQIANYLSLAKGKERVAKRIERDQVATLEQSLKFQKIITRTLAENDLDNYTPQIMDWLKIVYSQRGELLDYHIKRAVDYSRKGWHLKPGGDWENGATITSDHFIEGEVSND